MASRWSLTSLCILLIIMNYACTLNSDDHPIATTWEGTKILLKPACFTPPRKAPSITIPVVHAIAPPVDDKTLKIAIASLKKQPEGYTAFNDAKTVGEFYIKCKDRDQDQACQDNDGFTPRYGCLIVVRGSF